MKIAILGSGLVSQKLLVYLVNGKYNLDITVFSRSNNPLFIENKTFEPLPYDKAFNSHYDVVFGCTDALTTLTYLPKMNYDFAIDNSEAYRLNNEVPLLIPNLNDEYLNGDYPIVSNPNCVVIMLSNLLLPLSRFLPMGKCLLTSLQSVSGLGQKALDRLDQERSDYEYLDGEITPRFTFNDRLLPLFDNIVPIVGELEENGSTHEENKISQELKKIISPTFELQATCLRIPVRYGHTAILHVTLKDNCDLTKVKRIIDMQSPLIYKDNISLKDSLANDKVYATRLKKDNYCPYAFYITLFSNNLTIGAAYNSYQLFIKYMEKKHVL